MKSILITLLFSLIALTAGAQRATPTPLAVQEKDTSVTLNRVQRVVNLSGREQNLVQIVRIEAEMAILKERIEIFQKQYNELVTKHDELVVTVSTTTTLAAPVPTPTPVR